MRDHGRAAVGPRGPARLCARWPPRRASPRALRIDVTIPNEHEHEMNMSMKELADSLITVTSFSRYLWPAHALQIMPIPPAHDAEEVVKRHGAVLVEVGLV